MKGTKKSNVNDHRSQLFIIFCINNALIILRIMIMMNSAKYWARDLNVWQRYIHYEWISKLQMRLLLHRSSSGIISSLLVPNKKKIERFEMIVINLQYCNVWRTIKINLNWSVFDFTHQFDPIASPKAF